MRCFLFNEIQTLCLLHQVNSHIYERAIEFFSHQPRQNLPLGLASLLDWLLGAAVCALPRSCAPTAAGRRRTAHHCPPGGLWARITRAAEH